jgi:hypothetical protein
MADRRGGLLLCAGALALLSGCVERRFVIDSTPPGAKVYVNNRPVGFTPVDVPYTYYGTYLITLELDGYQTRHVEQRVVPTWYSYPPLDFVAENLNPFTISDVRRLTYELTQLPRPNLDDLRLQAEELRNRGRELPEPSQPPVRRPSPGPPPAAAADPRPRGNGGNLLPPPALEPTP